MMRSARLFPAPAAPAVLPGQTVASFARLMPYGYPGDCELIDRIYQEWLSPDPTLGQRDRDFHAQPAPRALRAVKAAFQTWLGAAESEVRPRDPTLHLLLLGGGPGRELLEYFQRAAASRVVCTYLDPDPRAIAYAMRVCAPVSARIAFQAANPFGFRTAGTPHLIWAAGVFDHLEESAAIGLLRRLWDMLAPGGRLAATHFLPGHRGRAFLESLGWTVHCRDESQVITLARTAGVPLPAVQIRSESEKILGYLHLEKPGN